MELEPKFLSQSFRQELNEEEENERGSHVENNKVYTILLILLIPNLNVYNTFLYQKF